MFDAKPLRWSPHTEAILFELMRDNQAWRHGYDLVKATGLGAGTVYPILARLAARGWLDTEWETSSVPGPRRHLYRLTQVGMREAKALGARARPRNRASRLARSDA